MRTLQIRSQGEDVRRLQARLNEIGNFGLTVDGIFGPATRTAVVRFQRSRGLDDDGIVGPLTFRALGITETPAGPAPTTPPAGRRLESLHIGLNAVDPDHYDGWDGKLSGCENDARTMAAIAQRDGFATTLLLTAEATAARVLAVLASKAQTLTSGDVFLLTYAGHGAQVPNVNGDDEVDDQDETWVTYERMLIDDELEAAFAAFAPGVDIITLSDSCHSGTVFRGVFDPVQLEVAARKQAFYAGLSASSVGGTRSFPSPAGNGTRGLPDPALDEQCQRFHGASATFERLLRAGVGQPAESGYVSVLERYPRLRGREVPRGTAPRRTPERAGGPVQDRGVAEPVTTRNMPLEVNASVVANHTALYAGLQATARGHATVRANGLSISGCQDAQLSQEVGGHGVFTTTLNAVWNNSTFTGSYADLHRTVVSRMGPTQIPVLGLWGSDPQSLVARTPFG